MHSFLLYHFDILYFFYITSFFRGHCFHSIFFLNVSSTLVFAVLKKCVYSRVCVVFRGGPSEVNLASDTHDFVFATSKQPWQSEATKLITMFVTELELHTPKLDCITNGKTEDDWFIWIKMPVKRKTKFNVHMESLFTFIIKTIIIVMGIWEQ